MAFEDLTGSKELYPESQGGQVGGLGKANDMYDYLSSSGNWESIDVEDVQSFANDGEIIIGAWKNESGNSGHVVLAVPGEEVSSNWGGEYKKVPQVMDTGYKMRNSSQGANFSFGSDKRGDVSWYKYSVNAESVKEVALDEVVITAQSNSYSKVMPIAENELKIEGTVLNN